MKTLPHAQTTNRLVAITALLACPSCGGPLQLISDTSLQCGGCQRRYPVRAGVPILLPESMPEPGVGTVSADDPVSRHPYSPAALEIIAAHHDGWVLDLGAGGKFQRWDNVIQVDIFRYPMTDVVATADRLPFRDNAFKAVISQAVFEHLQYPEWAAAEIRRVLQPGGVAKIDTAFLQPEHGYPHHFYNATETGLRHWFRDFDIQWSGVEAYQHPKWSLTWFLGVYLDRIGEAQAAALRGATLQQLLDALDSSSQGRVESEHVPILAALDSLPSHAERTLAAGVSVHLINPVKGAPESKAHHADTVSMHGVEDVRKLIAAREENALLRRDQTVRHEQHVLAMDRTRYLAQFYPGHQTLAHLGLRAWAQFRAVALLRAILPRQAWFKVRRIAQRMRHGSLAAPRPSAALPVPFVSVILVPCDSLALISTFFSLVRQTYSGWELLLLETVEQSPALRKVMDDFSSLDERVRIVSGFQESGQQFDQVKRHARGEYYLRLPDGATFAFDAIHHFVTLARDRPGTGCITADFEHGDIETGTSMRCHNFAPATLDQSLTGQFSPFMLVRQATPLQEDTELCGDKSTQEVGPVAQIPKVLFYHTGKPSTLTN